MSKHSSGPWRHVNAGVKHGVQMGLAGGFMLPDICEAEANAQLIASAPELLESLTALVTLFAPLAGDSTQSVWIDNARAAIAKARGEA